MWRICIGSVALDVRLGRVVAGGGIIDALLNAVLDIAKRNPERPAVVHNGRETGYGRLAEEIDAVRRRLGERPGAVAVHATHTPGTVAALLGVWAAGGTYCPVDPAFPAARQEAMTAAAGCRMMLGADGAVQPLIEGAAEPPAAAYVLFTSGSTGAPKPVVTPPAAIATVVAALRELFGLTAADRVLQFASLNWDTCFEEILPTLTAGATLVFAGDAHAGSFPRLLRMLERDAVTVLNLPTAFWHELVRHLAAAGETLPASVRLVVIGGEAVAPARLAEWRALETGSIRLLNTYGCTETTLITHAVELHPATAESGVLGRRLPHVLEHLTADGELLVGGPAVALGYLGLPAATAERFVSVEGLAGRWFRTGDRVRRLASGALLHEGRLDRQVKIRGIRVDPGEVEARIGEHPGVRAVAVVAVSVAEHTSLAAYVVPSHQGPDGLAAAVIAFLRERVPAHLVPGRITVVPELAYTASGKVDRTASHRRHGPAQRVKEALR